MCRSDSPPFEIASRIKKAAILNVSLTPDLERLVRRKAESARYDNAGEVIRKAVRLIEQRDEMPSLHKASIRERIAAGMASLRAGKGANGEDFMAALDRDLTDLERQGRQWRRAAIARPRLLNFSTNLRRPNEATVQYDVPKNSVIHGSSRRTHCRSRMASDDGVSNAMREDGHVGIWRCD